jgi:DNA-binding PadR family transcriptional regulator
MRPLRVLNFQREHEMDFVADCVLDLLSDFPKPTPTQTIVDECNKDKVSAPATTHKKLNMLKRLGLVDVHKHLHDNDGRKCYVTVSKKGLEYLNSWEGASK